MKDEELLAVLKNEMLLTEARALGAKEAYRTQAVVMARRAVIDRGIELGDMIVVHFHEGDASFKYQGVEWMIGEREPVLVGKKVLAKGNLSKVDRDPICTISYLHCVEKLQQQP